MPTAPRLTVIHLARKPLEGTVAQNVLKYGTGGLNIDGTRIGTSDEMSFSRAAPFTAAEGDQGRTWNPTSTPGMEREQHAGGRWPANVIFQHNAGCTLVGTKMVKGDNRESCFDHRSPGFYNVGEVVSDGIPRGTLHGDAEVEDWDCVEGCPCKDLDDQSGAQRSGVAVQRNGGGQRIGGGAIYHGSSATMIRSDMSYGDTGGASRFFKQVQDK